MTVEEIVEEFKEYTGTIKKDVIEEAREKKEEVIPKLLEVIEYTNNNIDEVMKSTDIGFFYAYVLLAEFKEQKAFPYLIKLINKDIDVLDELFDIMNLSLLPRVLASTYNGDDKSLDEIIYNKDLDYYVRCMPLVAYSILYFDGVKTRKFLIQKFKELLDSVKKQENITEEDKMLCDNIAIIMEDINLYELKEDILKFPLKLELEDFETECSIDKEVDIDAHPIDPFYKKIDDAVFELEDVELFNQAFLNYYEKSPILKELNKNVKKADKDAKKILNDMNIEEKQQEEILKEMQDIDAYYSLGSYYSLVGNCREGLIYLNIAFNTFEDLSILGKQVGAKEYHEVYKRPTDIIELICFIDASYSVIETRKYQKERLKFLNRIKKRLNFDEEHEFLTKMYNDAMTFVSDFLEKEE